MIAKQITNAIEDIFGDDKQLLYIERHDLFDETGKYRSRAALGAQVANKFGVSPQ